MGGVRGLYKACLAQSVSSEFAENFQEKYGGSQWQKKVLFGINYEKMILILNYCLKINS